MEGNQREREFSHWLCNIEGIGRLTARKLLRMAGSAQGVYEMREEELAKVLSQEQLKRFLEARRAGGVAEAYRELERKGIRHYPRLTRSIRPGCWRYRTDRRGCM